LWTAIEIIEYSPWLLLVYFDVTWRRLPLGTDIMLIMAVMKPSNVPTRTWFQLGSCRLKTSRNGIFPYHNTCVHMVATDWSYIYLIFSNLDKSMWDHPPSYAGIYWCTPLGN
jgi:hypothetical protein